MSGQKVLWVILADLSHSGVPVATHRMLRWLNHQPGHSFDVRVIARRSGAIEAMISDSATSMAILEPSRARSLPAGVALAAGRFGHADRAAGALDRWYRHRMRDLPKPDVVLVQGAGGWGVYKSLRPMTSGARVVLHLHELEIALSRSGSITDESDMFIWPDQVLAVSAPAVELARSRGARQVVLVPGAVDAVPYPDPGPSHDAPHPSILSIGQVGWRKGTDRAVSASLELRRVRPGIRWHWVGAPASLPWRDAVGTQDPLVRHGPLRDPWAAVPDPAGLVITSREDPFPLVALEGAVRGIPILATRTGGLPDLLGAHRGLTFDGFDLHGLVRGVRSLVDEPAAAAERAQRLRAHVIEHYTTDIVGPQWAAAVLGDW